MKRNLVFILLAVVVLAGIVRWGVGRGGTAVHGDEIFYVPNAGEGTVSVVDPSVGKTIDTISLGTSQASHGIALSPEGKTLYVGTGFEGKSLMAIDTKNKQKVKELKFTEGVHGIDISPDGKRLYVSLNAGLGKKGGGLAVIDAETLQQVAFVRTGEGPAHVAVTADGSQVWVTNVNGNTVAVIDAGSNRLLNVIPVGQTPNEAAITPSGDLVFVANVKSNSVSVIDSMSLKVIREIRAGQAPHGVTVSPDGKEVWVANNNSNDVSIIDIKSLRTVANIPTGAYANHVAFSSDGRWAYVTNRKSNDVVKIDVKTRKVVAKIPVGLEPHEISLEDYVFSARGEQRESVMNKTVPVVQRDAISPQRERVKMAQVGSIEIRAARLIPEDLVTGPVSNGISKSDFDKYEIFLLSFTTHSGDLSSLPIKENVFLSNDREKNMKPAKWQVTSNDSHHPEYLALFEKTSTSQLSLKIGGLGEQPVLFTWNVR